MRAILVMAAVLLGTAGAHAADPRCTSETSPSRLRFRLSPQGATPVGFKAYFGATSGKYGPAIDLGAVTPGTDGIAERIVDGVISNRTDTFIAVTAYSASAESDFSNEVKVAAPGVCPPTLLEVLIETRKAQAMLEEFALGKLHESP